MKERVFHIALILSLLLGGCAAPAGRHGSTSPRGEQPRSPATEPSAPPPDWETPTPPAEEPSPAPTAAPKGKQQNRSLMDEHLPGHKVIAETEHFVFSAADGYFPVDREWWLEQSEIIYGYVAGRLGVQGRSKVQIAFLPPEERACPVRGLASSEAPPTVLIYADENTSRPYLLGVLAHELGHAIPSEGYENGLPAQDSLTEGLATWAAGRYWLAWKDAPSLDAMVRGYLDEGLYEPLTETFAMQGIYPWQKGLGPSEDCLARRDRVYTTWGAFLGYLIETYGWQKAYRLFEAAPDPIPPAGQQPSPPSAFQAVYGKSLAVLEAEWLARVRREIAVIGESGILSGG